MLDSDGLRSGGGAGRAGRLAVGELEEVISMTSWSY